MATNPDCLFCRIVAGDIPSERVFEDDLVVAFMDIVPAAPTHILIVPREHISSISALKDDQAQVAGRLLLAARDIAAAQGLADAGYRIASNVGQWGGQTVEHLHVHLLGGRQLQSMG